MCQKPVARHPENEAFPFCSSRCKLADLGNWLGERYVVPDQRVNLALTDDDDPSGGQLH